MPLGRMRTLCSARSGMLLLLVLALSSAASCSSVRCFFRPAETEFEAGLVRFNEGMYEKAIPHFRRATECDPKSARAYLYLGRCYLSLGRFLEAIPPLRAALELSPSQSGKEIYNLLLDALIGARLMQS